MATILDELKTKANGKADSANNIQEAISMMELGGGGANAIADKFPVVEEEESDNH